MPDLDTFIITQKHYEDPRKKSSHKNIKNDDEEIKKTGTKSRPLKSCNQVNGYLDGGKKNNKQPKVCYPHKKHTSREAFLQNWEENFSKQWDVICKWSFQNKNRMYGSIQFESVKMADTDRERRLDNFRQKVSYLQK